MILFLFFIASICLLPKPAYAAPSQALVYADLPPPLPIAAANPGEMTLYLELVVNGLETGTISPVLKSTDCFMVPAADLHRVGLISDFDEERVCLSALPGVKTEYDASRQKLHLMLPPGQLRGQNLSAPHAAFEQARGATGALLNYEVFASDGGGTSPLISMWHEARLFSPGGLFSSTGVVRSRGGASFTRYDTRLLRSEENRMTTLEVGDVVTRGVAWASAVRLGGIQFSRDFSVRPDVITYPLPEFTGEAALPSTVELFINRQRLMNGIVNPGPFAIETGPSISGLGEANIVVTDMLGRSVSTTMPFYVSSALLRRGLNDYAVSIGALRYGYGFKNFDYGKLAGTASARHGLTNSVTLEANVQATRDLLVIGGGGVVGLGSLGVLGASYARSWRDGAGGGQLSANYEYLTRDFSINLRHVRQDAAFAQLGSGPRGLDRGKQRVSSVTSNIFLGSMGAVSAGYFDVRAGKSGGRLANISWSLPFVRQSRLHASASREFKERTWSAMLTLSLPLGQRRGTASSSILRDAGGGRNWRLDYARHVPSAGGLGVRGSVSQSANRPVYMQSDITWRTPQAQLRGGAYGDRAATGWVSVSGSLVAMDKAVFAANRIADAFALVSTNGVADIPIRYENQLVGRTNRRGHVLIPWVSAYYRAKYEIDPLSLDANVKVPIVTQHVAVSRGSGALVAFPIERMKAARATVLDSAGNPLSAGSVATVNEASSAYIGWDGMLFMENLSASNHISVGLAEGRSCTFGFAAEMDTDDILDLGTLTCR